MRQLYARRRQFSLQRTTVVKDSNNNVIYTLMGAWGSRQGVLSLYYIDGRLAAEIKQRSLGVFPKFELYQGNRQIGSLRRHYGVGRDMLFVKQLNWLVIGNLMTFNYRVFHGRELIMQITEVAGTSGTDLEFTITHEEDEPFCLCIAAILDYWAHSGKRQTKSIKSHHWRASFN